MTVEGEVEIRSDYKWMAGAKHAHSYTLPYIFGLY